MKKLEVRIDDGIFLDLTTARQHNPRRFPTLNRRTYFF